MMFNWLETEIEIVRIGTHETAPLYDRLPRMVHECIGICMRDGYNDDFEIVAGRASSQDLRSDLAHFLHVTDNPDYSQEILKAELRINFLEEKHGFVFSTANRVQTIWCETPHRCAFQQSHKLLQDMLLCAQMGSPAAQKREESCKKILNNFSLVLHLIGTTQSAN